MYEAAIEAIAAAGATVVDPADIPTIDAISAGTEEITVLVYEFKRDLNAYLATRTGVPIASLADAIAFNEANADVELKWFLQEWFELAESEPFTEAEYLAALAAQRNLGGRDGIDAVLAQHDLDAIVAPTGSPAWTTDLVNGDLFLGASSGPAAIAGYPLISVPAGDAFGLPVGLTFMGTAYSEPTLIKLASGFEQATQARQRPEFLPTLPTNGGRQRRTSSRHLHAAAATTTEASADARSHRSPLIAGRCGSTPPMDSTAEPNVDELLEVSKGWWLYLVAGVLWIIFGWVVLSFNFDTVWAVAVFFGFGFIIGGMMELFVAFQATGWRWLHIAFGVIAIIAGIVALVWPGQTFLVLAAIIGWYILFAGIMDIVTSIAVKEDNELWWLQLILGVVEVLIGFWAVGYTGRSVALLVIWVGASALARGISSIVLGFGLHNTGKELRKKMSPTPPRPAIT